MMEFDVEVFKELFDEKIKGLESKIDSGNELLGDKIETLNGNILKQNSRIGKLEDEDKRIEEKVDDAVTWAHHVVDTRSSECPNLPRIREAEESIGKINKSLILYDIVREHPRLSLLVLSIVIIGAFISGLSMVQTVIHRDKQDEIIQQLNEIKYPELYKSVSRGSSYNPFATDSTVQK